MKNLIPPPLRNGWTVLFSIGGASWGAIFGLGWWIEHHMYFDFTPSPDSEPDNSELIALLNSIFGWLICGAFLGVILGAVANAIEAKLCGPRARQITGGHGDALLFLWLAFGFACGIQVLDIVSPDSVWAAGLLALWLPITGAFLAANVFFVAWKSQLPES